jgi:methionyl-tRNA formyltransferase
VTDEAGLPGLAPLPVGHPSRLAYLGTPEASVPPLRALVDAGFDVALVVSQPDRRRGRGGAPSPSPVKAAAVELGLPVTDRVDDVLDAGADLGVVVAFGQLIRPHVLARLPMVNLHFSLLPRWRGAAPVERAILAGDQRTGVDLMVVEEGLDTGGVLARTKLAIGPDETAAELRDRLVVAGTELLVDHLAAGLGTPAAQQGEPTHAAKIEPGDLRLDWTAPASQLHRVVRVGGAWTTLDGRRLKVWRTTTDVDDPDGALRGLGPGEVASATPGPEGGVVPVGTGTTPLGLCEVQPEGKPRLAAVDWAHGARPAGSTLGVDGGPTG